MAVRLIVAVTDNDWFEHLRRLAPLDEVNFWSPSPKNFAALQPGELFLFKLHAPINMIVGGGVFAFANTMPLALAWEAFGERNGATSLVEMRQRILRYRRTEIRGQVEIGCRVLVQPFFLPEQLWIRPPSSWAPQIVSFRGFSTDEPEGMTLWEAIQRLDTSQPSPGMSEEPQARYGEPTLVRPRLGQGAFRLLVTDAYGRRCAITGERTLPALEAAHIKPYAEGGEHAAANEILMRRDIHSLFDAGYVTVTGDYRFEVSRRIKEDFENGRDYYALQGRSLKTPDRPDFRPDITGLRWHNQNRFLS